MQSNSKAKALKRCCCFQCRISRGQPFGQLLRKMANRAIRRAYRDGKADDDLLMVQSVRRD